MFSSSQQGSLKSWEPFLSWTKGCLRVSCEDRSNTLNCWCVEESALRNAGFRAQCSQNLVVSLPWGWMGISRNCLSSKADSFMSPDFVSNSTGSDYMDRMNWYRRFCRDYYSVCSLTFNIQCFAVCKRKTFFSPCDISKFQFSALCFFKKKLNI